MNMLKNMIMNIINILEWVVNDFKMLMTLIDIHFRNVQSIVSHHLFQHRFVYLETINLF